MWAAVDLVVDMAAKSGIKYRRGDFYIVDETQGATGVGRNLVSYSDSGVTVVLRFDFERVARKLNACKGNFYSYACCRIKDDGVYFCLPLAEIETCTKERTLPKADRRQKPDDGDKVAESEIFLRLTQAARETNVGLTYTNKVFFLRLLKLAKRSGEENEAGISVALSVQKMASIIDMPAQTIMQSLNRLADCGAVIRVNGGSRRIAAKTILARRFFEKEE